MKVSLEQEDILQITQAVVEALRPLLSNNSKDKSSEDVIYSAEGAANYLGVDLTWIYKHQKELKYFKLGKYVRFHKKDIDNYIKTHTMPALPYTQKEKKKKDLTS